MIVWGSADSSYWALPEGVRFAIVGYPLDEHPHSICSEESERRNF